MSFEEKQQTEDVQVETALRHFRESIHTWSEQEYARPRSAASSHRSGLWFLRNRVAGWGLASALTLTAVGVPTTLYLRHEQQVKADQQAALKAQALRDLQQRQAVLQINDEELMSHVDADISQAAPDAMQPLASLMSDTTNE